MTAQVGETLIYKGKEVGMATEPLYPYLKNYLMIWPWLLNLRTWITFLGKEDARLI